MSVACMCVYYARAFIAQTGVHICEAGSYWKAQKRPLMLQVVYVGCMMTKGVVGRVIS